jgi:hypothetical protein
MLAKVIRGAILPLASADLRTLPDVVGIAGVILVLV